jgi:hypothetical protein
VLRIVNPAGLIGHADTATGRVALLPQHEAAFLFKKGWARVGRRCRLVRGRTFALGLRRVAVH